MYIWEDNTFDRILKNTLGETTTLSPINKERAYTRK